jgi:hypothetical protein
MGDLCYIAPVSPASKSEGLYLLHMVLFHVDVCVYTTHYRPFSRCWFRPNIKDSYWLPF